MKKHGFYKSVKSKELQLAKKNLLFHYIISEKRNRTHESFLRIERNTSCSKIMSLKVFFRFNNKKTKVTIGYIREICAPNLEIVKHKKSLNEAVVKLYKAKSKELSVQKKASSI